MYRATVNSSTGFKEGTNNTKDCKNTDIKVGLGDKNNNFTDNEKNWVEKGELCTCDSHPVKNNSLKFLNSFAFVLF